MKRNLLIFLFVILFNVLGAQTIKGHRYKGFVNVECLRGNDGVYYGFNSLGGGINSIHGYQIISNLFIGAGTGFHYYSTDHFGKSYSIPLFSDFRAHFNSNKLSPYFDARLGYSVGDIEGIYASPSFGLRVAIGENVGFNVSVGYTAQGFKYKETYYSTERSYIHNLTISAGVDF